MAIRRAAATIITALLLPVIAFAANGLKVIPMESAVYDAMDTLYLLEGKALPSTTRPWTVAETEKILAKVDKGTSPELYAIIEDAVSEKPRIDVDGFFGMTFSGSVSVTGYAHTETAFRYPFNSMTNYMFKTDTDTPTFSASWETWPGEHFYSYVRYQVKNDFNADAFSSYHFNFDVACLTPEGFTSDLDQREPSRAFVVAGGEGWNIVIGRDRLSMGTGASGSLVLSDTFPYHNVLRFTAYGSRFKYSFVMSFLPHMKDDTKGILYYMTHRLECRFLSDTLYLAVNESIMYKNDNGLLDVRYVNPVMFFHNYFIDGLANSIVDLEAGWSFAGGWNMYFQFALDQFNTPFEKKDGDPYNPLAFGAMLGLKRVMQAGSGYLTLNAEAVYTMPYLYLRATNIPEGRHKQDPEDPGLGYIGLFRGQRFFVGYSYGNDAVVFDLKAEYDVPSDWKAGAEVLFMLNGEKDINSLFDRDDHSFAPSGDFSLFWFVELSGTKNFAHDMSVYARYDLICNAGMTDNQFVLGFSKGF